MINLREVLAKGHLELRRRHQAEEAGKLGTLRGGNAGCVLEDGRVVGKCPRLSLARSLGIQAEAESHRDLMFAAGHGSEDLEAAVLEAGLAGKYKILREADVPIVWDLGGRVVTGRPDIVLADPDSGAPVLGLELKLVSSYHTAVGVLFKHEPKLPHLIQLGLYSWRLGCPFALLYVSRVDWHFQPRDLSVVPKSHPLVEYNAKGAPKKVYPFYSVYNTDWTADGTLVWWRDGGEPVRTIVTKEGIEKYYRDVWSAEVNETLPPVVDNLTFSGAPMPWSSCAYCDFQSVCAKSATYEDFVTRAAAQFGQLKKEVTP